MKLKPESIEALLLDQSLGALSPEAEELLACYLETQPAARKLAAEFQAAAQLAKTSLARGPFIPLPEPHFKTPVAPATPVRLYQAFIPWLAAAACLVVGFGLAKLDSPKLAHSIQASYPSAEAQPPQTATPSNGHSFWLTNNLANTTAPRAQASAYIYVWDSPLKKPRIKSVL